MSDLPQPSTSVQAAPSSSADTVSESVQEMCAEQRSANVDADDAQPQLDVIADEADEQISAIEQSAISLHDHSSPRSLSAFDQSTTTAADSSHSTRPSTSSLLRPASAFNLPIDPRFPSDPSPQLLAVLQAADEADRLTANSHSPLLTERSAAAGRGERPESAAQLGSMDTLQGLPSQSTDRALSVMQSRMRWRESTRAERAARVERRRDELLAEFEAEAKDTFNLSAVTTLPTAAQAHNKAACTKQPLSTAIHAL